MIAVKYNIFNINVVCVIITFVLSSVAAILLSNFIDLYIFTSNIPDSTTTIIENMCNVQKNTMGMFIKILLNNAIITFLIMGLSIFIYKYMTYIILSANGFILTLQFLKISSVIGLKNTMLAFCAHMPIELTIILLVSALSLVISIKLGKKPNSIFFTNFNNITDDYINNYIFTFYIKIILPALILSAIFETFVSPNLFISYYTLI